MPNRIRIELAILLVLVVCVGAIWGFTDKTSNHEMSAIEEQAAGNATDFSVEEPTIGDEDVGEMPPIVFLFQRVYRFRSPAGYVFIDSQGNLYYTNDSSVHNATYLEFCEEFAEGKLDDILILKGTCSREDVYEKYKLLKQVSQNEKFYLWPDDMGGEVGAFTDTMCWAGFYYDENGVLSVLPIQKGTPYVTEYGTDEKAVQICEWFEEVTKDIQEVRDAEVPLPSVAVQSEDESYFIEPTPEEIAVDESTGISYVKNQVLVSAQPDVPRNTIKRLAGTLGAEIIGYIELTNDYQLEFIEDKTLEELNEKIVYLQGLPEVSHASLNYAYEQVTE